MIEFDCEYCSTHISIAPEQMEGELFCPACDSEVTLPELSPEMETKLAIAKAQAKNVVKEELNPEKAVEMLQEPDSKETRVWKERLAESFQAFCFKEYQEPDQEAVEAAKESENRGIKRIFNVFSKK
jgi:uncharacterized Zn finger protein (UPF0148 family)